jgi:hypothetical protein
MSQDQEARLLQELNSSGFPFQHAVVQRFQRAGKHWEVQATEFPLSYAGNTTHVDLVAFYAKRVAIVAECKRANPAFADWLFLRSPFTFQPRLSDAAWFDRLRAHRVAPYLDVVSAAASIQPWHIALEVKTNAKGDPKGKGRTLSEAIRQVQLAASGFISALVEQRHILESLGSVIVLPVVFTTARLLTSAARLDRAELQTGTVPALEELKEERWLFFESNVPPDILIQKVQRDGGNEVRAIGQLLAQRHARTIALVTATAVEEFLGNGMGSLSAGGAFDPPDPGRVSRNW